MGSNNTNSTNQIKHVFITPHTHWDREWYLPFQKFRYMLVKLVDELLGIMEEDPEYKFTFDGQTIVLEDYLEIRPERREELLQLIREKRIIVGPWYILPDIWLVGQETLVRNFEYSYDLAKEMDIPMMDIGYFPDSFGFSKAIPQLLGDLTSFRAVMLWRGVPAEVNTIPFMWKSDPSSETSILAVYLPFGYGNAASLPSDSIEGLRSEILSLVEHLQPFSPLPVYLLQNGTDHKFPDHKMAKNLTHVKVDNMDVQLATLPDYVKKLQELMKNEDYKPPEYIGELRSTHRANLLSNTLSARMWIKQWNERVEDLLTHYAEPLSTYMWYIFGRKYPSSYLTQAWKWFLRNQPHDSICGCSSDVTHEEMKFRYSWAQTISETIIAEILSEIEEETFPKSQESSCLVFNPTNCSNIPILIEIETPDDTQYQSIISQGKKYDVQSIQDSSGNIYEITAGTLKFRAMMKLFPGRKIFDFYINKFEVFDDGGETCEICILVGDLPIGEIDFEDLKSSINFAIESHKYKRFHVLITKEVKRTSIAMIPLQAWGFTKLKLSTSEFNLPENTLQVTKNSVSNRFYNLVFNKDGSFDLLDKQTGTNYKKLHYFEDWGDRGDEYTFEKLDPEHVKISEVKRKIMVNGPIFCEIRQSLKLEVYQEMDSSRQKRIGKEFIQIKSNFRFYRDIERIDVKTDLKNTTKDHRLRICFNLPFKTQHTLTSTHFGNIKRRGAPIIDEVDTEIATGIQPQKKYIRVEDPINQSALTLLNNGLPEIELVDGSCLAMTLLRSVGWLTQNVAPVRPELAGPIIATPGAQELYTKYTFNYSLVIQTKDAPISRSVDHSEIFSLPSNNVVFSEKTVPDEFLQPIIGISDSNIRISSLRMRNNSILVTLFNISDKNITTEIKLADKLNKLTPIKIDGSVKDESIDVNKIGKKQFNPNEIRMFVLN
ncbi:MAG: glycoside hydrolase family 38 N-terminal domain-containing protein [Candidatus Hodarchaeales archaeon]|jgi:alpha-mannosidase